MYDFAVAGAGPAGLSAAITAAEAGLKVVVIEKGAIAGPEPRGESMPQHDLLDKLVRPGFIGEISNFKSFSRRFHSPSDKKSSLVKIKEPYYFFDWRDFIDPLYQKAASLGADFIFDAHVTGVKTSSGGRAAGLFYTKAGQPHNVDALTVLGCGGRSCPVAAHFGIDTTAIACPTVKYRGSLKKGLPDWMTALPGSPDLQFFTVLPNSFKSVSGMPPAFAYVFPLGNNKIEVGLMLRLSQLEKLKGVKLPTDTEMLGAWEEAKNSLPGFCRFFENAETEYEKLTSIQNRCFISENIMQGGGAVLLGDSMGMVDANGSAGLYYSMAHANAWVEMLSKAINSSNNKEELWSRNNISSFYKHQSSWPFYKYIKGSFGLISIFERMMFKTFGTDKKLNFIWPFISALLKAAS